MHPQTRLVQSAEALLPQWRHSAWVSAASNGVSVPARATPYELPEERAPFTRRLRNRTNQDLSEPVLAGDRDRWSQPLQLDLADNNALASLRILVDRCEPHAVLANLLKL